MKITNSFLVVTNYDNDISWVPKYTDNYVIYNKTGEVPDNIDPKKVIDQTKYGQGMYDYLSYIVDNYDDLPEMVQFVKGNIFPRLMTQEKYDSLCNNAYFTPLEDYGEHDVKYPNSCLSCDGGYLEYNDSWYLKKLPHQYFQSYNAFMSFVYQDPILPVFIRFAPGGCYIVHRDQIKKLPKKLYETLKGFLVYAMNPAEAHMMERSIYTWWTSIQAPNWLHLATKDLTEDCILDRATMEDAHFLFDCRNSCRDGLFNSNEVEVEEHVAWLGEQLKDSTKAVFVCKVGGKKVGTVRWAEDDEIKLHWSIMPEYRGRGFAKLFVKKMMELLPNEKLVAEIKADNISSAKVALANGFTKVDSITWENFQK